MARTADVVVVGGGVNGTSITYALASRGVKCALVEKGALASGASGRSSALVRMHYTMITEGRAKTVDIEAFSLSRFARGQSVDGPYPYATRPDHVDPSSGA